MTADVVVIGGGPAGCSAAIRLAQANHKVRLYEKSRAFEPCATDLFSPRSSL